MYTKKFNQIFFTLWRPIFIACIAIVFFFGIHSLPVHAQSSYTSVLSDDADLFTTEEENDLKSIMDQLTTYGNVALLTLDYNYDTTSDYANSYLDSHWYYESSIVFVIDMDNREVYLLTNNYANSIITKSYCYTITDNIYRDLSKGNYYDAASKGLSQCLSLLQGAKISQPMKYVCNLLIAIFIGLFLNFFIAHASSITRAPSKRALVEATNHNIRIQNVRKHIIREKKIYHASSSSGSGGGSHSSSGGGGGGGSHSSSGGGHSF